MIKLILLPLLLCIYTTLAQDATLTPAQFGKSYDIYPSQQTVGFQYQVVVGQQFLQVEFLGVTAKFNFTLEMPSTNPMSGSTLLKPNALRFFKYSIGSSIPDIPSYNIVFRYKYNSDNSFPTANLRSIRYGIYVPSANRYMTFQSTDFETDVNTRAIVQGATSLVDLADFDNYLGLFAEFRSGIALDSNGLPVNNAVSLFKSSMVVLVALLCLFTL